MKIETQKLNTKFWVEYKKIQTSEFLEINDIKLFDLLKNLTELKTLSSNSFYQN